MLAVNEAIKILENVLKIRIIPCLDVDKGRVVKELTLSIFKMLEIQLNKQKFIVTMVQMKLLFWTLAQHMRIENLW